MSRVKNTPQLRLLVVCGLTASGKTNLALHLAKLLNGEIISADSRQVYKGFDIGTGKDLPKNSKFQITNYKFERDNIGFFEIDGIRVWGYDLANPKDEFNISQYLNIANKVIKDILGRDKLPIVVGGTGFYIKGIVDGIDTSDIPKNKDLRIKLEGKNVDELILILEKLNPQKVLSMNSSDIKNPRRLIRAIEISSGQDHVKKSVVSNNRHLTKIAKEVLFIGLKASQEYLNKKIEIRVKDRVGQGMEKEITKLLESGVNWEDQSMNTLSYKEWRGYFTGKISKEDVIAKWILDEKHYAKRQMTWFKKDKRINWFDITKADWRLEVEKLTQKWHN